jgi:hypothetical protein
VVEVFLFISTVYLGLELIRTGLGIQIMSAHGYNLRTAAMSWVYRSVIQDVLSMQEALGAGFNPQHRKRAERRARKGKGKEKKRREGKKKEER